MALIYSDLYPLQTLIDAAYPQGKAKNVVSAGDGTGTPWEAQLINDFFGFQQSLLDEAGITPSGSPDEVGASDYMDSLKRILSDDAELRGVLNWETTDGPEADGEFAANMNSGAYDPISGTWLVVGSNDNCNRSTDDGATFELFTTGMASGENIRAVAIGGTSSAVIVTNSTTYYRTDSVVSGSWVTVTAPSFGDAIVYDPTNSRFIVVGGSATIATSNNPTGTAFTDRSGGLPAPLNTFDFDSVAVNNTGVVVAFPGSEEESFAVSLNGGIDWVESTTTDLNDGFYTGAYSQALDLFVAVRAGPGTTNNVYTSADGLVWTEKFSAPLVSGSSFDSSPVKCYGRAFVVAVDIAGTPGIAYSTDGGVSWSSIPLNFRGGDINPPVIATSRTNNRLIVMTSGENGYRNTRLGPG